MLDGTVVLDPAGLRRESDEEVIARLSTVRGIGQWTAEMFLMFQLRRLDVWPTGDLGVRKGLRPGLGRPNADRRSSSTRSATRSGLPSVVAWYCWRAAEIYGSAAESALTR